ncbi:MAG: amino acid permease [Pirellulaceae bacterium]
MTVPSDTQRRAIGLTSLVCLVVANMIGAGVYTTSGYALDALGSPYRVLAVWGVASIIAVAGAICYGGLSRQLVQSGGEYLFLSRAVHPLAGFMAGWISLLAGFTGAIAYSATTFVKYLPTSLTVEAPTSQIFVACCLIALGALLHLFHTGSGAVGQNLLVVLKLGAIGLFIVWGCYWIGLPSDATTAGATASSPVSLWTYANQLMWVSFSFAGFNASIYVAGEAKLGEKTVRASMLYATLGVALVYLLLNFVFLFSAPTTETSGQENIAAIAADHLGGNWLRLTVNLLVCLSLATGVSAMLQAGPRVYVKMAEDGLLPKWFVPAGSEPRVAIVVQAVLAMLLVCLTQLKDLLDYTSFLLSVSSAATVLCLLLPKFRGIPGNRPCILWPILPACFATATLVIAGMGCWFRYHQSPTSLMLSSLVFLSGILFYAARRQRLPPA